MPVTRREEKDSRSICQFRVTIEPSIFLHMIRIDKRWSCGRNRIRPVTGAAGRETVLVLGSPLPLDDCFAPVDATRSSAGLFAYPMLARHGESGARARLAFRTSSVATSLWQIRHRSQNRGAGTAPNQEPSITTHPGGQSWCDSTEPRFSSSTLRLTELFVPLTLRCICSGSYPGRPRGRLD
jgi:hypothetical protein